MINIILCGGNGTRLWPISRKFFPKQFCKFFDNQSLFQKTVIRNRLFCKKQFIVSNEEQYFLALDQLEELNENNCRFMLEPVGRNTAPAIALACLDLEPEDIVLVTPSDHLIKNESDYEKVLNEAKELAEEGYLVTFGIKPEYPETGFGYIEADGNNVKSFKEKPDFETAKKYLDKGNFYWNSGMFVFKVGVFLEELQKHSPEMYDNSKLAYQNAKKDNPLRIKLDDMLAIPKDSIDYAVMEKSERIKVVPAAIGWSDLGSFESLYKELPKDGLGNISSEKNINLNSKNNFVYSSNRTIATIDIEDLIVVDTQDVLLLSKKGSSQKVKEIVKDLENKNSDLHKVHVTAHRPWGTYTVLEEGDRYKIKKILVKPGAKLSLQKHYHRNEHWVVVSGTAKITIGENETILRPNESTYIPMGQVHRLENPGKIDLIIIEAQVGDYLGEDDIVRIVDDYKRE
ncbi:MAG: mannose-phosphate guanylyltransferase [Clostridiales bacterium]|jgi:mannose-1-phosphate guanylyltransferase|nr:mannose-phosphate guanylyltransferase [Clostridiales bacterium]